MLGASKSAPQRVPDHEELRQVLCPRGDRPGAWGGCSDQVRTEGSVGVRCCGCFTAGGLGNELAGLSRCPPHSTGSGNPAPLPPRHRTASPADSVVDRSGPALITSSLIPISQASATHHRPGLSRSSISHREQRPPRRQPRAQPHTDGNWLWPQAHWRRGPLEGRTPRGTCRLLVPEAAQLPALLRALRWDGGSRLAPVLSITGVHVHTRVCDPHRECSSCFK